MFSCMKTGEHACLLVYPYAPIVLPSWEEALYISTLTSSPTTVLTPADDENHIDKLQFKVPFVCGARNLGEALRRIAEGAAMIRTKGEAGTGQCVEEGGGGGQN